MRTTERGDRVPGVPRPGLRVRRRSPGRWLGLARPPAAHPRLRARGHPRESPHAGAVGVRSPHLRAVRRDRRRPPDVLDRPRVLAPRSPPGPAGRLARRAARHPHLDRAWAGRGLGTRMAAEPGSGRRHRDLGREHDGHGPAPDRSGRAPHATRPRDDRHHPRRGPGRRDPDRPDAGAVGPGNRGAAGGRRRPAQGRRHPRAVLAARVPGDAARAHLGGSNAQPRALPPGRPGRRDRNRRADPGGGPVARARRVPRRPPGERVGLLARDAGPGAAAPGRFRRALLRHARGAHGSPPRAVQPPAAGRHDRPRARGEARPLDGRGRPVRLSSLDRAARRRGPDADRRVLVHPRPGRARGRAGRSRRLQRDPGDGPRDDPGQRRPGAPRAALGEPRGPRPRTRRRRGTPRGRGRPRGPVRVRPDR